MIKIYQLSTDPKNSHSLYWTASIGANMKFRIFQHPHPETHATDCIIVGFHEKGGLSPIAKKIDTASNGFVSRVLKQSAIEGKSGDTLLLHHVPGIAASTVLLVGIDQPQEKNKNTTDQLGKFRKAVAACCNALQKSGAKDALFCLTELPIDHLSDADKIRHAAEIVGDSHYRFEHYKSEKKPAQKLMRVDFFLPNQTTLPAAETALKQADAILKGAHFTRDLGNQPSNICTPTWVAAEAKKLAKEYSTLTTKVLDREDMQKLGMGAFLAVAKGSAQEPRLVCIEYNGSAQKNKKTTKTAEATETHESTQGPVVLIGKGITFDTGGVSLKPSDSMVGMKYDMCGAATVLGTLKAVAELALPIHLVGILALAENMPSGTASKPEDIVTSLSGQTIEILNTDAEGRLVLCDALTYAERYHPSAVIDIATLTGAVVIALGQHATGLLSNHQPLADALLAAGKKTHDRAWQLPLWDDYQEQLKSPFADMSNVGGRPAGTITAACFLSRFAKKFHWAHLDVAGTAAQMFGNAERYATGRPVPLLTQFLIDHHDSGARETS